MNIEPGTVAEIVGQRLRVPGIWGSARIVSATSTSMVVKWPWYWRALNWVRVQGRSRWIVSKPND